MNEYLSYFLDEKQVVEALDFPDDGIEYAYMLQKEDLDYLLDVWDKYSQEWRVGISYFAGCAPLADSLNLLIHGLNDSNEEIKFQSLCSILQSASEELEDFGEIPSILNPLLINRLLMEIRNSSQIQVLQEDFSDIINVLKQKGNFSV
jgi:hypothetical protein